MAWGRGIRITEGPQIAGDVTPRGAHIASDMGLWGAHIMGGEGDIAPTPVSRRSDLYLPILTGYMRMGRNHMDSFRRDW